MILDRRIIFLICLSLQLLLNACHPQSVDPIPHTVGSSHSHAVSRESSGLLWSVKVGEKSAASEFGLNPVLSDHWIYTSDASGNISAVTLRGKISWKRKLAFNLATGPAVWENLVVVGGEDGKIYALNCQNGHLRWQAELSNEILMPPVMVSNKIITVTLDGVVKAFEPEDGHELWNYQHPHSNLVLRARNELKTADGMVVVGFSDGKLINLDIMTGQIRWQKDILPILEENEVTENNALAMIPLISDNTIYVATSSGKLIALTLQTGETIWEAELAPLQSLVADETTLYVSDTSGTIWAIDRESGTVLWKQNQLASASLHPLQLIHHRLIVSDIKGNLYQFNKQNGRILKTNLGIDFDQIKGKINSLLLVNQNNLYFLTDEGYLVAYGLNTRLHQ